MPFSGQVGQNRIPSGLKRLIPDIWTDRNTADPNILINLEETYMKSTV